MEEKKDGQPFAFGTFIEKVLVDKKRSIRWLAEVTGIPYSTLRGRLGSPDGRLSFPELQAILRALDLELSDLINHRSPAQMEFDFHRRIRGDSPIILIEKVRACLDVLEDKIRHKP